QRSKGWTTKCCRIAVAETGRAGAGIGFANARNRPPEIVVIFRFPNGYRGIGHCDIDQGEQTSQLHGAELGLIRNMDGYLIVESRRCAKTWRSVIRPKGADECLLRSSLRSGMNAIATKILRFIIGSGVGSAGQGGRRRREELAA